MRNNDMIIENARIIFRNFSGKAGAYNPEGRRTFSVVIEDEEMAENLKRLGWNVKVLNPIEEGDEPTFHIQINVNFNNVPPKIVLIKNGRKTILSDAEVGILDWAEFENVDLAISPYSWEMNGRTGIKGYLRTGFFTVREDALEAKYADIPDTAQNVMVTRDE